MVCFCVLFSSLPPEYYISSLRLEEAEVVNSLWKFSTADTLGYFQMLLKNGPNSCIRLKSNQEPIAWCLLCAWGDLGALHVREGHRRQGLATAVVLDLIQNVRRDNQRVYAFVDEGNVASTELFKGCGFSPVKGVRVTWVLHKPIANNVCSEKKEWCTVTHVDSL